MLAGKVLEPVRGQAVAAHSVFTDAARGGVTVLVVPPGRLLTEGLTQSLLDVGRRPVWLRLGTEDRDPATLLLTMVAAVRRRVPGFGVDLLRASAARPGPIFGWDGLYQALGEALASSFPADAALVIDHADRVDPYGPALELACRHVIAALPEHIPRVVIGHAELPATRLLRPGRAPTALPAHTASWPALRNCRLALPTGQIPQMWPALRDGLGTVPGLGPGTGPRLGAGAGPGRWLRRRRATGMLRGSAAVRAALAFARTSLADADVAQAFRGSSSAAVLASLAQAALARADTGARRALAHILQVGYVAPADQGAVTGPVQGPWFQPLADGWWRLRTVWHGPLVAALGDDARLDPATLRGIAVRLLREGAAETAVPMLIALGDQQLLVEALRPAAAEMIGNGQWSTLGRWLDALPAEIIEAESALLDAAAHVTWSRGRTDLARRWFDARLTTASGADQANLGVITQRQPDIDIHRDSRGLPCPEAGSSRPAGGPSETGVAVPGRLELAVHVLGPLAAAVNGQPVGGWGARQRSLLAYLVLHRAAAPPREVVMEALWPGADPAAARNNLQVAVHGLRRVFRAVTSSAIVVFDRGVYQLAPEMVVSVDLDAFEGHVQAGCRLVDAGCPDEAIVQWEAAMALYRGDFLADGRSDDWAVPAREQLRLTYLDALDQLSVLYLDAGRPAMCALLCRQILERDPCREDAHRRLMRSYSRQGQPHLALLQFRTCADFLARELRVAPAPATARLHEKVRRHEPI
ncbi:BTAD domain-containing putative transcriptional regulator [Parafrankia elaeagni]|uniref:BTAD domain-containing putative transcriptional regulator n=1 Tax=Parafrankia elaeagni TaxID=222534 RepID=UPI0003744FFF|nr:BTAD domain-containing putative transcriptional regulator [Parafrankia elaeagni]